MKELIVTLLTLLIGATGIEGQPVEEVNYWEPIPTPPVVVEAPKEEETDEEVEVEPEVTESEDDMIVGLTGCTAEEIQLMAALVWAEASGESYDGKRLVVDTVMNRVDHEAFPDDVTEVIYQSGQFTPTTNGSLSRGMCEATDECYMAVLDELTDERLDSNVLYFNRSAYGSGTLAYKYGNHYFSYI